MAELLKLNRSPFPLNCPDAKQKYDRQPAEILVRMDCGIVRLVGKFVVHQYFNDPAHAQYISVHVNGRIYLEDPVDCGWAFHLEESHLASIEPIDDGKDGPVFLVQKEFLGHLQYRSIYRPPPQS
jgi:hypothetical protein